MYMQRKDGTVFETIHPEYNTDSKPVSAKAGAEAVKRQDAAHLRKLLKPGGTVYTVLRHVSGSGMSRRISVIAIVRHGGKTVPQDISGYVASVCGYRRHDRDGSLIVGGCGMDMGHHVVYEISRCLFPKGFRIPKGQAGRNGDTSGFDNDGGYALNQRWL